MNYRDLVSKLNVLDFSAAIDNLVFVPVYTYLLFIAFLLSYSSLRPRVMCPWWQQPGQHRTDNDVHFVPSAWLIDALFGFICHKTAVRE